jgi:hypothetical protein
MISKNFSRLSLWVRSVPLPSGSVLYLLRTSCFPRSSQWPQSEEGTICLCHLPTLALLPVQAYFGSYPGGPWWGKYRSSLWLPAHSDHFAVRHRCRWRVHDEDPEPHYQVDADEVLCLAETRWSGWWSTTSSYSCSSTWYGILFSDCSSTSTAGCWLCSDIGGFGCTLRRHELYAAGNFINAAGSSLY